MIQNKAALCIATVILLLGCTVSAQQWTAYDAAFTASYLTQDDLTGWTVTGNTPGNVITSCVSASIVGGFNAFGIKATLSKNYAGLPAHTRVRISFTLYSVDSWDNEFFQVFIDGIQAYSVQTVWQYQGTQICGNPAQTWTDRIYTVNFDIAHTQPTLSLKLTSNLDSDATDESWGIRDFDFAIQTCGAPNCFVLSEEFTNSNLTSLDVTGWSTNKQHGTAAKPWVSTCGTYQLIGGFNSFGESTILTKTYSNLPQHYKIAVSATLVLIDNYDPSWIIGSIVDGVQIEDYHKPGNDGSLGNICGNGQNEDLQYIGFTVAHSAATLTLTFQDNLPAPVAARSWGIREIRIQLIACTTDCTIVTQELQSPGFTPDDVQGFTFADTGLVANAVTQCGGVSVFGGFAAYSTQDVKKVYTKLPEHTHIYISLKAFFIDIWETELFWVIIDGVKVDAKTYRTTAQTLVLNSLCGLSNREDINIFSVQIPHISDTLTLTFQSDLDQVSTDEAWGVRELQIVAYKLSDLTRAAYDFGTANLTDLSGWTFVNDAQKVANPFYTCKGIQIVGGWTTFKKNTHLTKTFTNLPAHGQLRISFRLYQIDSWDVPTWGGISDSFWVLVDGVQVKFFIKNPNTQTYGGQNNTCGDPNSYKETIIPVEVTLFHSATSARVEIYDTLDSDVNDESWGFRDFIIYTSSYKRPRGVCAVLYSECQFVGKKLFICDQDPDFNQDGWYDRIKSVQVPNGWKISLFPQTTYQGDAVVYTSSQNCLQ